MSFILDALKKSETERQRQSGPALFEVKVAPPRGRVAFWAAGLGALLAINLGVIIWMALHGSSNRAAPAHEAAQPPGATFTPSAPAPATAAGIATPRRIDNRYGAQNGTPTAAPTAAPSGEPPPLTAAAGGAPAGPATTGGAPAGPATDASATASPDDLAPAVEPQRQAPSTGGEVVRATDSGLPTYQDVASAPGANLPDLHLDLNDYSPEPGQSFVFLNNVKLHEGDALPVGVRVEHILRDGVVLSYRGTRFVLQTNP